MLDPNKINKYLYIEKTPTWKVRMLYSFGILSWLLVLWGFSGAVLYDPFYRYFVGPILVVLTIYQLSSFILNLFYRQFDLPGHLLWVTVFWTIHDRLPSVDIFLPICGEDISILRNTWEHVSRLHYRRKHVYVLDDSSENCVAHKMLAAQYGFTYLERPNKGEMKKAGNLKYGFERSTGEFIAIFDADFAPHPDFLMETLPYMSDRKVGIVQTPQYFESSMKAYKMSPLAYAGGFQQEIFYRVIQVARDRLGGPICCGTNAVYRRAALNIIGGPHQVDASEDTRTGFALMCRGWAIRYIPIILAIGVSPDNIHAYFHQQHRWCRGRSQLVLSKEFLKAPVRLIEKVCIASGFFLFLTRPFEILLTFHLFWVMIVYHDYVSLANAAMFYPYIVFAMIVLPIFHITRLRPAVFYAGFVQLYANMHALFGVLCRKRVGWIATGSKQISVSSAFKQTMYAVGLYVSVYGLLILFTAFLGYLHPLNINYYSVQFWLFYNMALSVFLFWQMYRYCRSRKRSSLGDN